MSKWKVTAYVNFEVVTEIDDGVDNDVDDDGCDWEEVYKQAENAIVADIEIKSKNHRTVIVPESIDVNSEEITDADETDDERSDREYQEELEEDPAYQHACNGRE